MSSSAIAENLEKKADLGRIAKATKDAEPTVREWLAVIALWIACSIPPPTTSTITGWA